MRALALVVTMLWGVSGHAELPKEWIDQLGSNDEDRAIEAAKQLGQSNDVKAVTALIDALNGGPNPDVTVAILQAMSGKREARVMTLLGRYAQHRDPEVRKAALVGIAAAHEPQTPPALLRALGDSSGEVRAQAAELLASRRDRGAEARLLKLLQHRDPASAKALAAIASPQLAYRLTELVGAVPDPLLCATLGEILKRPEFGPDNIRIELVHTLSKIPSGDATTALVDYVAATAQAKERPSRRAAEKIIDDRSRQ